MATTSTELIKELQAAPCSRPIQWYGRIDCDSTEALIVALEAEIALLKKRGLRAGLITRVGLGYDADSLTIRALNPGSHGGEQPCT